MASDPNEASFHADNVQLDDVNREQIIAITRPEPLLEPFRFSETDDEDDSDSGSHLDMVADGIESMIDTSDGMFSTVSAVDLTEPNLINVRYFNIYLP